MYGLSSGGKAALAKIVEDIFDRIALQFLGDIPRLKEAKRLLISSQPNLGLAHLFVQAMTNKTPNLIEQDALKSMLQSSDGYIESLKNKTKSNLAERVDGLAKEARLQNRKITEEEIEEAISEEMGKAKSHLEAIIESESTKYRNVGSLMSITRVSTSLGDTDPTVYFVVIKDQVTCKECLKLHLMPDEITPRLYKLSELKQGYHKRGETSPSAFGLHPHCRCTLVYLSKGFDFDKTGKLKYEEEAHDAYSEQRK